MSEVSEILKTLIRFWLKEKYESKEIKFSDKLLNSKNVIKLVDEFLNTKPYDSMKNEVLILSIINKLMQIEIYRILLKE
tara:strand:- start:459 stop:695 length:237 start_codon:yes stop_codon:yes gene_type:complete